LGKIIEKVWLNTTQCYSDVILDEYVIMPNHFHGIIGLDENSCSLVTGKKVSLGDVVSSFKRVSLREFKESVGGCVRESVGEGADSTEFKGADSTKSTLNKYGTFWQKSFYDHIIRNDKDLFRIQEYIINNPINWELDSLHPNNFNK
jgi:REP element-mobilizing transposase RayT